MTGSLPTGSAFRWRIVGLSWVFSFSALPIVLATLWLLLDLTSEQWGWFCAYTFGYFVLATPVSDRVQRALARDIAEYLDLRAAGRAGAEQRRRAFAAVLDLPRRIACFAAAGWIIPVILVSTALAIHFSGQWGRFETGVVLLAGFAAGFVAATFNLFVIKRLAAPVRAALAAELPDPDERRGLIRPIRLRAKLLVCTTGVTVVPVIFAVMVSDAHVDRAVERFTLAWQRQVIDELRSRLPEQGFEAASQEVLELGILPASLELALVEPEALLERAGLEPHVAAHVLQRVRDGEREGDAQALPTEQVFSWARLTDGRVLLAVTPVSELRGDLSQLVGVFVCLLLVATVIATGLAWLLSRDVAEATEALRAEAERLASGDLRRGEVFESEDELGELSRAFESMATSIRETVARVAAAADGVESHTGDLSAITDSVTAVTAEQVQGLQQASSSMEAINEQVRGIAESSQALNVSVEESSSSILELGAAGEELRETASVLTGRVDEVSSSIEQMVRSVRQVTENTSALSEAAVETSASMEEMASSMREVDTTAEETARLSGEVVGSAEAGQAKVRQTIDGMDAIREATETAERVIRSLGERTTEIGAIIDVIDDVADETNLLALNAAIIAAQAGEHGRAFSVVADEIKDLADRVLASTKEIGTLIRSLQQEASDAIGAVEQGSRSVASGVDLSAEAGVSLEQITRASRETGTRISGIVSAVREQARAAGHVVDLMERVRTGVELIRSASQEQDRGNEVVFRSTVSMREVAQQVQGTTEEQARGSGRIRESVEEVREAVERIHSALQEQSASCRSAAEFLEAVYQRTRSNDDSAQRLGGATRSLVAEAEALRTAVQRFRI